MKNYLNKISLVHIALFAGLAWFLPSQTIDPWGLISLKKITSIVFALTSIQLLGQYSLRFLGQRNGSIVTGFLGGMISSTATILDLAQKSKISTADSLQSKELVFLSATLAMLIEGILLFLIGADRFNRSLLIVFSGPVLTCAYLIAKFISKSSIKNLSTATDESINLWSILKLSLFIIFILCISKIIQNVLGANALLALTFFVSLFEVHGSMIANIQLQNDGTFNNTFLGNLVTVSISATFLSKYFLISFFGSSQLKIKVLKLTLILFSSLLSSWLVFIMTRLL